MKNNTLFYLLLYFFTARTAYTLDMIVDNTFFEVILLRLVQIVSLFVIAKYTLKIQYKKPLLYLCIFFFSLLISSVINGTIYHFIANFYPFVAYSTLIIWAGQSFNRFKSFVQIVSKYHLIILAVNLFTSIFFPDLFGEKYLLGNENLIGYTFIVGFVYNALDFYLFRARSKFLVYSILVIINDMLVWSGGTLIGLVVLLACLYIPIIKNAIYRLSLNLLLLAFLGVFVVIVFLNSTGILEGTFVENIIVGILGKEMSFTGRAPLWLESIYLISQSPLLGHGIPSDTNVVTVISESGQFVDLSTHNQFLQTAYEGGIVAILALVPALIYMNSLLKEINDNFLINLSKASILSLFFMYLVESPSLNYFFELYVILCVVIQMVRKYSTNSSYTQINY